MLNFFYKMKANKKGFTLIELIVVIAILAILVLIAVPRLGGFRTDAADRTSLANIRILQSAAMMSVAENGNPTTNPVTWSSASVGTAPHLWADYVQAPFPAVPAGATTPGAYTVTISTTGGITVTQ